MSKRDHRSRRIVTAVLDEPWLMLPEKLEQIRALLELRASGGVVDEETIRVEFGGRVQEEDDAPQVQDGLQLIRISDTLAPRMNLIMRASGGTSTQLASQQVLQAAANPDVKTIVLEVDSPGGAAAGTIELAETIRQATKQKRVVTIGRNIMASGAYWVGAAATEVFATPSTQVGSIGVFGVTQNVVKAAEKQGVEFAVFRAGKLKGAGNPYEVLTDERRASIQERIDEIYDQFISSIADYRGVTEQRVIDSFGQGTVFLADKAMSLGMIDGVGLFEELLEREREMARSESVILTGADTMPTTKQSIITQRVKAGMFATELIDSLDVADETCEAILAGYLAAKGIEATDEKAICAAISGGPSKLPTDPPGSQPGPPPDTSAAERKAREEERARVKAIRDRALVLEGIGDADVNEAIDNGWSLEQVSEKWVMKLAKRELGVSTIKAGDAASDKFSAAGIEVLMGRAGFPQDQSVLDGYGRDCVHMSTIQIAEQALKQAGKGNRVTHDKEATALEFLKLGGSDAVIISTADPSGNRPGDHPDLLSGLANKMLNVAYPVAGVLYREWTYKMADLPDLKPKSIIDTGIFSQLDELLDDEPFRDLRIDSELASWMQAGMYGNRVGLTPVMVTNDDLDGFGRTMRTLAGAAERTLNRLCLEVLTGNPTMPDGTALFHADHNNLVTAGGAPSAAQAAEMRRLHRLQTNIGGEEEIDEPPSIALCPAQHETAAKQTFLTNYFDEKVAATDANINTVRGEIRPLITSRLDAYSTDLWYTFVEPSLIPAIAHAFQRGYGPGGQRTSWFDNNRRTRYFALEARFAAAAVSWRGVVQNDGVT